MIDAPKYKLGSICEVVSGGTPRRSERSFWDGGTIPWVKISDITGKRVGATEEFITDEGLAHSSAKLIQPGAVLYSIFASIGATGILTIPAATNQAIAAVRPKDGSLSIDYLYHWLKAQENVARASSRGVAQNNINLSILRAMEMPLPDYGVQEGVAASFDAVLARRDSYSEQLVKLDELVKSRFIEMFGDGSSFEQHVMADLLAGIVSGTNVSGNQRPLKDGEFAVLKISAVTKGWFKADEYKVVDDVSGIRMVHPRRGDLLFSRANTSEMVGATAIVDCDYDQLFLPDKLWRLDPAPKVETVFLKQLLSSPQLRAEMSKVSTGTSGSMQNISMAKFRRLKAFLPPLALQQEFAAFVQQVDKLKFETQQAIDKLQLLYDSLAQEYFAVE